MLVNRRSTGEFAGTSAFRFREYVLPPYSEHREFIKADAHDTGFVVVFSGDVGMLTSTLFLPFLLAEYNASSAANMIFSGEFPCSG